MNWGLYGYGSILTLGLLAGIYYFWRLGREEHLDEISLFDTYFLSLFGYYISGRIGYYLLNTETLDSITKILAIIAYPGLNQLSGLIGASAVFVSLTFYKQWNTWKLADMASVSLALTLVFGMVAHLVTDFSRWITSTAAVIWAVATYILVRSVKKNFRFYEWYKQGSSMAKDGLAAMMFVASGGVYLIIETIILKMHYVQIVVGIAMILTSGYGIIYRAGKRK